MCFHCIYKGHICSTVNMSQQIHVYALHPLRGQGVNTHAPEHKHHMYCMHAEDTDLCIGPFSDFILIRDLEDWRILLIATALMHYRRTLWSLITPLRVTLRRKRLPPWFLCLLPRQNHLTASSLMSLLYCFQHFSVSPFLAINMNEGRYCAQFVNSSD